MIIQLMIIQLIIILFQVALQRMQEQEREMLFRQEQAKQVKIYRVETTLVIVIVPGAVFRNQSATQIRLNDL
jgi:hypothetical protein